MIRIAWVGLLGAVLVCGCAHKQGARPAGSASLTKARQLAERNNAVSLLYDLLQDEQNLDKILIIKHGSPEFDGLIKAIALTSHDAGARLEQMAAADRHIRLHALELPAGEKATRDGIARTKEQELLFSGGDEFQFELLLTQVDALSYGWHLAKIAANDSTQPDEARAFTAISTALENLYDQDLTILKAEARKLP